VKLGQVGRRGEVGGKNFGVKKRLKKSITLGKGGCVFCSSQNSFNSIIFNWCISGYWFTPATLM
jgi:hypothetical protein